MPITKIDTYLDTMTDDWMRNTFVDRLENARMLVDDESYGDPEKSNEAFTEFMKLGTAAERAEEVSRLRIVNTVDSWARRKETSIADINTVITSLRAIRDEKQQPEPEPEPEEATDEDDAQAV